MRVLFCLVCEETLGLGLGLAGAGIGIGIGIGYHHHKLSFVSRLRRTTEEDPAEYGYSLFHSAWNACPSLNSPSLLHLPSRWGWRGVCLHESTRMKEKTRLLLIIFYVFVWIITEFEAISTKMMYISCNNSTLSFFILSFFVERTLKTQRTK